MATGVPKWNYDDLPVKIRNNCTPLDLSDYLKMSKDCIDCERYKIRAETRRLRRSQVRYSDRLLLTDDNLDESEMATKMDMERKLIASNHKILALEGKLKVLHWFFNHFDDIYNSKHPIYKHPVNISDCNNLSIEDDLDCGNSEKESFHTNDSTDEDDAYSLKDPIYDYKKEALAYTDLYKENDVNIVDNVAIANDLVHSVNIANGGAASSSSQIQKVKDVIKQIEVAGGSKNSPTSNTTSKTKKSKNKKNKGKFNKTTIENTATLEKEKDKKKKKAHTISDSESELEMDVTTNNKRNISDDNSEQDFRTTAAQNRYLQQRIEQARIAKKAKRVADLKLPSANPTSKMDTGESSSHHHIMQKIPPVIIRTELTCKVLCNAIYKVISKDLVDFKVYGEDIKALCKSTDAHRKLTTLLDENDIGYVLIPNINDRPLKIVIKGLPINTPHEDIEEELINNKMRPRKINQLRRSSDLAPLPIFQVHLDKTENVEDVYDITELCCVQVVVEPYLARSKPLQCYNCQGWNHGSSNCHCKPKCVKCAGEHPTRECKKPLNSKTKCANCGGAHTANYSGCPKAPRSKITVKNNNNPTTFIAKKVIPGVSFAQAAAARKVTSPTEPQSADQTEEIINSNYVTNEGMKQITELLRFIKNIEKIFGNDLETLNNQMETTTNPLNQLFTIINNFYRSKQGNNQEHNNEQK